MENFFLTPLPFGRGGKKNGQVENFFFTPWEGGSGGVWRGSGGGSGGPQGGDTGGVKKTSPMEGDVFFTGDRQTHIHTDIATL